MNCDGIILLMPSHTRTIYVFTISSFTINNTPAINTIRQSHDINIQRIESKPAAYSGLSFHLYVVIHFFRMTSRQKSSPATCMESSPFVLQFIVQYNNNIIMIKRYKLKYSNYIFADFAIFSAIL